MNVVDGRSHFSPKMWSLLYASFALLVVTGATWAVTVKADIQFSKSIIY